MDPRSPNSTVNDEPNLAFTCTLCNVKTNSVTNYEAHITGKNHQKKLKSAETSQKSTVPLEKSNQISSSSEIAEASLITDESKMCKPCDKIFSDPENAKAHYKSKKHLHKLSIIKNTWCQECIICDKKFSNKDQWELHIKTSKHLKATQKMVDDESFMESFSGWEKEVADQVLQTLKCELCVVTLSGKKPAEDHLKSKNHAKKITMNLEKRKEMKECLDNETKEAKVEKEEEWSLPHTINVEESNKNKRKLEGEMAFDVDDTAKKAKKECLIM